MAIRRADEHTRMLRQSIVSSARLRGMSIEEIVLFLAENDCVNPRTNKPWSITTVQGDLKQVEAKWEDEMLKGISEHRMRVLAEIQETKAAAWKAGQLSLVLKAIGKEVELLGLNELERIGVEIALANLFKGFPKEIADQLKTILSEKVRERKGSIPRPRSKKLIPMRRPA